MNKNVSDEISKLRSELVKYEINYRSFIFNNLLKYLNVESYNECISKLKEIKDYLDNHDDRVREYLISLTNDIRDYNYSGTLSGNLNKWYRGLTEEQRDHLYDSETNEFLRFIQKCTNNEIEIIDRLAYIFSNLSIEDWNDNSINIYLDGIKNSKEIIESYEVSFDKDDSEGLIKIVFENPNSKSMEKTFNKTEISPLGSTLFNAIEEAVEEYGDSIDDNEKRNILMEILSKYI